MKQAKLAEEVYTKHTPRTPRVCTHARAHAEPSMPQISQSGAAAAILTLSFLGVGDKKTRKRTSPDDNVYQSSVLKRLPG